MNEALVIKMLGDFSITYHQNTINTQSSRSKKVWLLLEYLITFRNKDIPQNELIEALWGDEELDNPVNALKTLLHRTRAVLAQLNYGDTKEMILCNRGSYSWNNDQPIAVDTDQFEDLLKAANQSVTTAEEESNLALALQIYQGDFLPQIALEPWVVPIVTYFHSLYLKAVERYVEILIDAKKYNEIIITCKQAIIIDPYDEDLYYDLILALYNTGAQQQALRYYDYVKELFFSKFGVNPSPKLTALYKDITKTSQTTEMDLSIIKEDLTEHAQINGAFFCEYEVFKDIYRLQARTLSRTGETMYIGLITVTDSSGNQPLPKQLNKNMEKLQGIINTLLRKGDVFVRYSVSQFMIILPGTTYESANVVLQRVANSFRQKNPKSLVFLRYSIQPLTPSDFDQLTQ